MSCCGGCGGQDLEKEKEAAEKKAAQQAEQKPATSNETVEQFDPSKK